MFYGCFPCGGSLHGHHVRPFAPANYIVFLAVGMIKSGHAIKSLKLPGDDHCLNFLSFYVNLIRAIVAVIAILQLFKRDYKKLPPAAITIALTFVPWLLSLMHIPVNKLTGFLFPAVVFMGICLGSGFKYYDIYS